MDIINKIFVFIDFFDIVLNVFCYVFMLAGKFEVDIELLYVIYLEYEVLDLLVMVVQAIKEKVVVVGEVIKEFVEIGLIQMYVIGQLLGVFKINFDVEIGMFVSLIVDVVCWDEVEFIVMGICGEYNVLDWFWGSVIIVVVEYIDCYVWVVLEYVFYYDINVVGFVINLGDVDLYYIWEYGKFLAFFYFVFWCVYVNLDSFVEKILDIVGLFMFFDNYVFVLQISFYFLEGVIVMDGLEDFIQFFEIDVLAMYVFKYSWWDWLF